MEPIFKAAETGQPDNPLAKLVPQIEIAVWQREGRLDSRCRPPTGRRDNSLVRAAGRGAEGVQAVSRCAAMRRRSPSCRRHRWCSAFGIRATRRRSCRARPVGHSRLGCQRSASFSAIQSGARLCLVSRSFQKRTSKGRKARRKARWRSAASFTCRRPGRTAAWSRVAPSSATLRSTLSRCASSMARTVVRHYILGLALVAAIEPLDGFLRQGCLLVQDARRPPNGSPLHATVPACRSRLIRRRIRLRHESSGGLRRRAPHRVTFKRNWRRPI